MIERYVPSLSEPARRWLRFVVLLVVLSVLGSLLYTLRAVFTPILAALAIAYVLNPLVTLLERRARIGRLTTVIVAYLLLGAVLLVGGAYLLSGALAQIREFAEQVPGYVDRLGRWVADVQARLPTVRPDGPADAAPAATRPAAAWWGTLAPLLREHGAGVASSAVAQVGALLSSLAALVSLFVLVPLFAFFFLWRFNDLTATVRDHLPARYRDRIVHIVATTDAAIANFFRGRLMVCALLGVLLAIGWLLVGVRYSLLLGLLGGVLSLVPYMSLLAVPPALLFAYLGAVESGQPWLWPVVLAAGVYLAVQALESFLLSPLIESQANGLHPLTTVLAILIGAQVAGLLGMLLAIPIASTLKTLAAEFLLPEIRRLAQAPALALEPPPDPPPSSPAARPEVPRCPSPLPRTTRGRRSGRSRAAHPRCCGSSSRCSFPGSPFSSGWRGATLLAHDGGRLHPAGGRG